MTEWLSKHKFWWGFNTHRASQLTQWKRIHLPVQKMQETQVQSLGLEDPHEWEMATTPAFFPGDSHGQRNLVGYSPWGSKELDMTEWLSVHVSNTHKACKNSTDTQKIFNKWKCDWYEWLLPTALQVSKVTQYKSKAFYSPCLSIFFSLFLFIINFYHCAEHISLKPMFLQN